LDGVHAGRVTGALIDITREKEMLDQLHASALRMKLAEEAASFGVWERDRATEMVTRSEGAARLSGVEGGPLRRTIAEPGEHVHPEDREKSQSIRENSTNERGQYENEFRVMLTDGSVRWCRSRGRIAVGEDEGIISGAIIDITNEKAMMEKLHQSV